jgi:acetyl-CoA acyltransferase 2
VQDAAYLARHVGLRAGLGIGTTSLTVNRLCGSGFEAVVQAARSISSGEAQVVLAGGAESMSQAPLSVYGADVRFGHKFGMDLALVDTLWAALTDRHVNTPMALTAENLAVKYKVSREDADRYGLRSQQAWAAAQAAGVFGAEIEPVSIKSKKGEVHFHVDEHPRADATLDKMAKLPPVFKKDGTVSAGNASGIGDGAAALVVASEAFVKQHKLRPLARVVSWGIAGVEPTEMGIGPVPAIQQALRRAGLKLADVGLVEVNEAFASQYLAVERELGLDRAITNKNGGAIAISHPLGASGARILTHLAHRLPAEKKRFALGSACIGGGQGIAVVLENAQN